MNEDNKILKELAEAEKRIRDDIANARQHETVNIDAMVSDVKSIRRMVEWLKTQWEKFSRGSP